MSLRVVVVGGRERTARLAEALEAAAGAPAWVGRADELASPGSVEADVALLVLGPEGRDGLRALPTVRYALPGAAVLVFQPGPEEGVAEIALAAGVQDVLSDDDLDAARLRRALLHAVVRHRAVAAVERRSGEVDRLFREAEAARAETLAILESGPGSFLVLEPGPEYRIVTASGPYLSTTMRKREELVGRALFDAFPDDPAEPGADGVRNLRESLERVEATLAADAMAVQRYPIPRPLEEGGGFEVRYWSAVNAPVLGPEGGLLFIIHRVEDVTEYVRATFGEAGPAGDFRVATGLERMEADLIAGAREIQRLNRELAAREAQLRRVFEGAAAGIAVTSPTGRFLYANEAYCRMLGYTLDELRALEIPALTHPDDRPRNTALFSEMMDGRRPSFVLEKRYLRRDRTVAWARVSVSKLDPGHDGEARVVAVTEDITERRLAEERARFSERLLTIAGRAARLGGWSVDLDSGSIDWSDVVCEIHEMPTGTRPTLEEGIGFYAPEWRPVITEAFTRCAEEGTPFDLALELVTATGRRVWVRAIGEAVRDEGGMIRQVRGAFQDLTNQKAAEEALLASEAAFHQLAEAMPAIVWSASPEGVLDYVTSALERYAGLDRAEILGKGWRVLIHPDEREEAVRTWEARLASPSPYRAELRIRRHDGVYRWHVLQAQPALGADGALLRWYGTASDVHDLRVLEEESRRLAERLTTTLESITEAVFTLDPEWRVTFINAEGERLLGRGRAELLGRHLLDAFPEARGSTFHAEYARALRDHVTVSFQELYPPLDAWFSVNAYPSEEGLAVFFTDVTERRAAEEQLRHTEARFRNVARATSDAVWDWDLTTDTVWWSDGLTETFGVDHADIPPDSSSWTDRIHPDDLPRVTSSIHGVIEGDGEEWADQYRFRKGDGSWATVHDRGFVIRDAEGRGVRMVGGMTDDTERLETIERLREQADLLDRAQDAILVRDLDHTLVYANKGAERMYGWAREEMVGRLVPELLYDDPAPFHKATAAVLADGEWTGELVHRTKSGDAITVEGRWSLVRGAEGRPRRILAINTDVTERKRLLTQFLRAQRMESIGTLAGGIAHDLNNVLAPILLSIGMLRSDIDDPGVSETLATIETSARRGAEMVKQVLAFARGVDGAKQAVTLSSVVDEVARVVRDTFPKNVMLRTRVPDDLWPVVGDPTQIQQVLLNLLVNARDAMPSGGAVKVEAENTQVDEHYAAMTPGASPGAHVRVSVTDTGTGMPSEILDQIFDPFFTTKEVGRGTGLGLSTVAAIVRSHGGFINVYSEPGKGTRFALYLPAADGSAREVPGGDGPVIVRGKGELILVVDDEHSVREITRQTLETFGYRVVTATDGADAVAAYGRNGKEVALVLTDIMMPIMDGPATIRALLRMNPAVRIIAASGMGAEGGVARAADSGVRHFLPKPYTAEALLTMVAEVLQEARR